MKRRYYFDTSVFGGVFDEEFKEDSLRLFELVKRREIVCLYSGTVEKELIKAPGKVKDYFRSLQQFSIECLTISFEAEYLAESYVKKKIVGHTNYDDCLHIALATVNRADLIISWNFKHIVNQDKIKGYNSINLAMGYNQIQISSPRNL